MLNKFTRPQHTILMQALSFMDDDMLLANQCWFGGGTAIVLKLGEYRQSLDVDFLCASTEGYRELRSMAVAKGVRAFFPEEIEAARDVRVDQYGIRAVLRYRDQLIKFEIVKEARIALSGAIDPDLGLPTLTFEDMFSEKLLANADRCQDRSVGYRDAIDLGMLLGRYGEIPHAALAKSVDAYGSDIEHKLGWVVAKLGDLQELRWAADALQMDPDIAEGAIMRLRTECDRLSGSGQGKYN